MIDIEFYMKAAQLKRQLMNGWQVRDAAALIEQYRSEYPLVFNVETTNACNMTCGFCPHTTKMTRPITRMQPDTFYNLVGQIEPHPRELWDEWVNFAAQEYGVSPNEQSENAFFLYILPRVLVLHGYGDPLLDPHMADYVYRLTAHGIPSYFSCNPHNINLERLEQIFDAGLTYIKFSVDSLSDPARGRDSFARDYPNILKALEMPYQAQVIITMIDLGKPNQQEEFAALKEMFPQNYVYLKSLDQAWMTGKEKPQSIHWREFCQIPWSSMTINAQGLAVGCEEDYNGEIVLGDTKTTSLYDIWNGSAYRDFRRSHFDLSNERCVKRCDMQVIGKFL